MGVCLCVCVCMCVLATLALGLFAQCAVVVVEADLQFVEQ